MLTSRSTMLPIAALLWLLMFPVLAGAHQLKTDGDMGVIMHVDPDDDPVAGETATFYFEIADQGNGFSVQRCACVLHISRDDKKLSVQPIPSTGALWNSVAFVFPAAGIYRVEVAGTPKAGAAFRSFRIAFDVRVERSEKVSGIDVQNYGLAAGFALLVLLGIGYAVYRYR